MTFCGKMEDNVLARHKPADQCAVTNISNDQLNLFQVPKPGHGFRQRRVGQCVQHSDFGFWVSISQRFHQMTAYEPRAACDQDGIDLGYLYI